VPQPSLPPRAWLIVALLWFTVLSNYLARVLFTTMHGSIVTAIPMTEAQFGLLTSSLLWTYGFASPFAGFLSDRFNRSRVIIASTFLWSMITWLTSYARSFEELVLFRSLMGLVEACYMPAALALICDYHRGPTRSRAVAIHHSGFAVGLALSGWSGWLAELRSWHYTFAVVGFAGLIICVPLILWLRDPPKGGTLDTAAAAVPKPHVRLGEAIISPLSHGYFLLMLIVHALLNLVSWVFVGWAAVFLQEHFHLTQGFAGISSTGYMNAAVICGIFVGGIWADRWSLGNYRARMFVPAIGLLIGAPGILLVANGNLFAIAILGLVIYSLFSSFYEPNTMPVLCEVIDARYRATGYGMLNAVGMIAAGLGIYFSGVVRDLKIDLRVILDACALMSGFCALLYYVINPRGTPRRAAAPLTEVAPQ
jgi:MFS family permease